MLEIKNLTAGYSNHPVLQNIDLTIPQGKVTVILGPNGCGKSTLLKAIAGLLPCEGEILLKNHRFVGGDAHIAPAEIHLKALSPRERAKQVACLPQNRAVPEITARRLVLHGRFPYLSYPRRYSREDLAMADAALEKLGIFHLADREVSTLSGGQRQKVYLAMALAQDTPVLLLDEPNTFLDIAHQMQMMALARQLASEGKTLVLVLHDLALALENADHLVLLCSGQVACTGTAEEVFACGCLEQTFGVTVKRTQTEDGWKYYYGPRG